MPLLENGEQGIENRESGAAGETAGIRPDHVKNGEKKPADSNLEIVMAMARKWGKATGNGVKIAEYAKKKDKTKPIKSFIIINLTLRTKPKRSQ